MSESSTAADLDLRLVRYFVAVAEHRHFGRAAAELVITQPSLSRQIRRLEQQVGAGLLDRTPQGTRLTEAGEVFLADAKALLRAARSSVSRTRAAAQPRRVTVGYTTGVIATPAVLAMRRRHPDAEVTIRHLDLPTARTDLLDGEVDAVVTRLPFASDGLTVTVLYDEPRVLVVPLNHRFAGKESVTFDDIADEPLPHLRGTDPAWAAYWRLEPRPDGRPAPDGPVIEAMEDKFEVIAAGEAVVVMPDIGVQHLRPDLTTVKIADVEPSHVVVATRAGDRNRLVAEFRRCAQELLTGPEPGSA
ncbi:LysR substrate-binding domain-containing protein [Actinomycetospora endophytica]|uniref:LysR substrate-binding domain-containing protein n=1 Tax=Actinomycetospora endophytica TaxID=2291215 RepID=A0ABS8PFN3_9PSEU|nr:LysR family transcriptional regulator [Actinomycetospora endophytica]MCD2196226.1 LysR substrate-binding domain-containing protein [Actinomycetospora endophytica]